MKLPEFKYVLILYFITFLLSLIIIFMSNGTFVYTLDDAYIHTNIAQNLYLNGIWSANNLEFSSSSSSIIWPLLIFVSFFFIGVNTYISIVLNLIFGLALLYLTHMILSDFISKKLYVVLSMFLMILITPLMINIFSGMESVLFGLISLMFVYCIYLYIQGKLINYYVLIALSLILGTIRFESIFFIPLLFVLIILYTNKFTYKDFLLLSLYILIPIFLFGFYSIHNGASFLPNSVLLKVGGSEGIFSYIIDKSEHIRERFSFVGLFVISLIALAVSFFNNNIIRKDTQILLQILSLSSVILTIIHLFLARFGWLFRYEYYIISIAFLLCIIFVYELFRNYINNAKPWSLVIFTFLFITLITFPYSIYSLGLIFAIGLATVPVDIGHLSPSIVISSFDTNCIITDGLGAVGYNNSDKYVIDTLGLGNDDVATAFMNKDFYYINNKIRSCDTAFVEENNSRYSGWYKSGFFNDRGIYKHLNQVFYFKNYIDCERNSQIIDNFIRLNIEKLSDYGYSECQVVKE